MVSAMTLSSSRLSPVCSASTFSGINVTFLLNFTDVFIIIGPNLQISPKSKRFYSSSVILTFKMTSSGSVKNMTGTKEAHTLSSGNINNNTNKKKAKNPLLHLIAGGTAGLVESSICHPLDTIKTRMQLRRTNTAVKHAIARSSMVEPIHRSTSSLVDPTSIKNVMRRSTSTYDPTTLAIKKGLSSLSEPSTAFRSHNPTGTVTGKPFL